MKDLSSLKKLPHYPVMLKEVLSLCVPQKGGQFIDCTFGSGGYTNAILSFPKTKVTAFDNDELSILALKKAINHTQGLKPIVAIKRNLSTQPLVPQELKKFDTIVFDPPRSGAKNQVQQLVASKVKRIIAVSCNPSSFASDASVLARGGFTLKRVTPVDQFKFTPHIELVAQFERF